MYGKSRYKGSDTGGAMFVTVCYTGSECRHGADVWGCVLATMTKTFGDSYLKWASARTGRERPSLS